MAAQQRSMQSTVVQRCLQACHGIDGASRVVSMTTDGVTGLTHLRVRAGDAHTLEKLRGALGSVLRLSTTSVTENWVDGTLEADVTVLTSQQERLEARRIVARGRVAAYWLLLAWFFLLLGLHEWWSSAGDGTRGKDEL